MAFLFVVPAGVGVSASLLPVIERSRKTASIVLQRWQEVGKQSAMAVAMGCSDSTLSRLKDQVESFSTVLSHLGLKCVPVEYQCTHPGELSYLRQLRRRVEDHAAHLLNEFES